MADTRKNEKEDLPLLLAWQVHLSTASSAGVTPVLVELELEEHYITRSTM
jgi:hypothetical protein